MCECTLHEHAFKILEKTWQQRCFQSVQWLEGVWLLVVWPVTAGGAWSRRYSNQHQRYSGMTLHIRYTEYTLASNVLGRWKHLCWCSLLNRQYLIVGQMCLVCIWFVCETCKDIATLIPAWTVCCASRLGFLCLCPMWLLRVVNLAKEYWQSVQGTTVYIQMKTFVLNYITNDRLHFDMFAKSCTII